MALTPGTRLGIYEVTAQIGEGGMGHIYGLEESDGVFALVMELVDGEDVSQRIARGAMPIDEALPHEQGN